MQTCPLHEPNSLLALVSVLLPSRRPCRRSTVSGHGMGSKTEVRAHNGKSSDLIRLPFGGSGLDQSPICTRSGDWRAVGILHGHVQRGMEGLFTGRNKIRERLVRYGSYNVFGRRAARDDKQPARSAVIAGRGAIDSRGGSSTNGSGRRSSPASCTDCKPRCSGQRAHGVAFLLEFRGISFGRSGCVGNHPPAGRGRDPRLPYHRTICRDGDDVRLGGRVIHIFHRELVPVLQAPRSGQPEPGPLCVVAPTPSGIGRCAHSGCRAGVEILGRNISTTRRR